MKKIILIKQLSTRNLAHILEHCIIRELGYFLLQRSLFSRLDYEIYGRTNDNVIYLELSSQLANLLEEMANFVANFTPNQSQIKKSLNEISIEYQKNYTCDFKNTLNQIKKELTSGWNRKETLKITTIPQQEAWSLQDDFVSFSDKNRTDLRSCTITYTFDAGKNLSLKPLSIYVTQIIALAQIDLFYLDRDFQACYDLGDEWLEYPYESSPSIVKYETRLGFSSQDFSLEKIKKTFNQNLQLLSNNHLTKKLQSFIKNNPNYIDSHDLFIRTGLYIGDNYFMETNSIDNLRQILDNIKIKFIADE